MNVRAWFLKSWPGAARRHRVMQGYVALGQERPELVTDIALRGGLFAAVPIAVQAPYQAGVLEGRRQMALEIVRLSHLSFDELYRLVEPLTSTKEP